MIIAIFTIVLTLNCYATPTCQQLNKQSITFYDPLEKINVTRNFEFKKSEFELKRKIIVSHELIAGGFLNVN